MTSSIKAITLEVFVAVDELLVAMPDQGVYSQHFILIVTYEWTQ